MRGRAQDPEFELDTPDSDLLVSCCMYAAESIEVSLISGEDVRDEEWDRQHLHNLYSLALEFAQSPVELIRGPGRGESATPQVQKMVAAIDAKAQSSFHALPAEFEASLPAARITLPPGDDGPKIQKGDTQMDDWMSDWSTGKRNPLPDLSTPHAGEVEPPGLESEFGVPATLGGGHHPDRPVGSTPGLRQALAERRPMQAHQAAGQPNPRADAAPVDPVGIDIKRMKDPRLRSTLLLDLKALRRAMDAQDHRMTAVHLSSVFEGVATDVALQRRAELGLRGTPDNWQLQRIVPAILGGREVAMDRNTIHHLVACKNLVRPTSQMVNPIVVTRQTVERMLVFLRHFLEVTDMAASDS
jgi:hypothetical protein